MDHVEFTGYCGDFVYKRDKAEDVVKRHTKQLVKEYKKIVK